jgi:iron complex transport system substrate-binding protein
VRAVPSVGGFADPSFEAILGLAPDLVVGVQPRARPDPEAPSARGLQTVFPPTDRMAEIDTMLIALGDRPRRADRARKPRRHNRGAPRAHRGGPPRKAATARAARVRLAADRGGGVGGCPYEMLTLAGADNVVTTAGARYPTLGVERLLALDPDVIVDATGVSGHETESVTASLPGWAELRAIRQGRLLPVRDERVLRPGPRIAEGLEVLARAIHPSLRVAPKRRADQLPGRPQAASRAKAASLLAGRAFSAEQRVDKPGALAPRTHRSRCARAIVCRARRREALGRARHARDRRHGQRLPRHRRLDRRLHRLLAPARRRARLRRRRRPRPARTKAPGRSARHLARANQRALPASH